MKLGLSPRGISLMQTAAAGLRPGSTKIEIWTGGNAPARVSCSIVYTTLGENALGVRVFPFLHFGHQVGEFNQLRMRVAAGTDQDRKSTRLNSSHVSESRMP